MSSNRSHGAGQTANPKPFSDVSTQVAILERRGLTVSDRGEAERFLLRENYYSVVNGYKDAFIDRQATNLAGEDRFVSGTSFDDFMLVYTFDKALRSETIRILLDAEACMKTATIYAFCDAHHGADDYLDPSCYCPKSSYSNPGYYTRGLIRLLSTLQSIRDNKPRKQYIAHYTSTYHCLPLWVASKCVTFGTMSAFFDYQHQSVKTKTCVAMARALGVPSVPQRQLAYAYHTLPDFRNICAHDERLYCARVGNNNDRGLDQMLRALGTVTTAERLSEYAKTVDDLLDDVASRSQHIERELLVGMDITRADLRQLIIP